jgi:hypothetical protein
VRSPGCVCRSVCGRLGHAAVVETVDWSTAVPTVRTHTELSRADVVAWRMVSLSRNKGCRYSSRFISRMGVLISRLLRLVIADARGDAWTAPPGEGVSGSRRVEYRLQVRANGAAEPDGVDASLESAVFDVPPQSTRDQLCNARRAEETIWFGRS